MDCCNFDCPNTTSRRKMRCGRCRRSGIRNCCVCGSDVVGARGFMCKNCSTSIRHQFMILSALKYRAKMYAQVRKDKICVVCKVQLPYHKAVYCSNDCLKRHIRGERRVVKWCVVCTKSLEDSKRKKTCSDECYLMYSRKQARDYYYKKGIVLGLSTF